MNYLVVEAKYLEGYKIDVTFQDGKKGVVDLKEYPGRGGVFSDFRDKEYFKRFTIDYGTLVWENEVDIAPERLYEIAS